LTLTQVEEDDYFLRDGDDLHVDAVVPVWMAALGGTVEINTLEGTADVTIPPGTQPSTKLALRGKGVTRLGRGSRGDLVVQAVVEVPEVASSKGKIL
ncbi:unnamed protein product, partial [Discosporangium mesarthrocarpum]